MATAITRYVGAAFSVLCAIMSVSCAQVEERADSLELNNVKDEYKFNAKVLSSKFFEVYSYKTAWTVEADADWITVNPVRGCGGRQTVSITPANNNLSIPREAKVIFKSALLEKTITVTQLPGDAVMELSVESMTASFDGRFENGNVIRFVTNGPWTATAPEWASLSQTEGNDGVFDITVSVEERPDREDRSSELVFISNEKELRVKLVQKGKPESYVRIITETVELSNEGKCLSAEGGAIFETNDNWTLVADSWLHVDRVEGKGGEVFLNVTADKCSYDRNGLITITCGKSVESIKVKQMFVPLKDNEVIDISKLVRGYIWFWTTTVAAKIESTLEGGESSTFLTDGVIHSHDDNNQEMASLAYMDYQIAPGNVEKGSTPPVQFVNTAFCAYSKTDEMRTLGMFRALQYYFGEVNDGDGFHFHLPLKEAKAGQTLELCLPFRVNNFAFKYWKIQYCLDSENWIDADVKIYHYNGSIVEETEKNEVFISDVNKVPCNIKMFKSQVHQSINASLVLPYGINNRMVEIRLVVADAQSHMEPDNAESVSRHCHFGYYYTSGAGVDSFTGPDGTSYYAHGIAFFVK